MSTATAEVIDSLEQLEHTPPCEGRAHKQDPPPAQFLVDMHGCTAKFACSGCVNFDRQMFVKLGGADCRHCLRYFPTFESAEWAMRI